MSVLGDPLCLFPQMHFKTALIYTVLCSVTLAIISLGYGFTGNLSLCFWLWLPTFGSGRNSLLRRDPVCAGVYACMCVSVCMYGLGRSIPVSLLPVSALASTAFVTCEADTPKLPNLFPVGVIFLIWK